MLFPVRLHPGSFLHAFAWTIAQIGGLLSATEGLFSDAQLPCTTSHDLAPMSIHQRPTFLSLSALAITDTELRLIAALAIIGLSSTPNAG